MRIVIELSRAAQPRVVLNNLMRQTALRSSFNSIMLALVDGQPQVLPLRRCLELFIRHREEVIRRRAEYQLQRARDRDHIVQGLLLALDRIDEVIEIIRGSADVEESRNNLTAAAGFVGSAGAGNPGYAATAPGGIGAGEAAKGTRGFAGEDRGAGGVAKRPGEDSGGNQVGNPTGQEVVQQPAPHHHPGGGSGGGDAGVADSAGRRHCYVEPAGLRETGAAQHLPAAEPGGKGVRG